MRVREINAIVIHCAATKPSQDIGAFEIRQWHTDPKRPGGPFADIGYHFVIRRNGEVELGREVSRPGAHAAGYNGKSIGICLVGGLDAAGKTVQNGLDELFTSEQRVTLAGLVDRLGQRFGNVRVVGHRDLPGVAKACPGFDVRTWAGGNWPGRFAR